MRSKDAIPSSPHATASPSIMQERAPKPAIASTINGKRSVRSLPGRLYSLTRLSSLRAMTRKAMRRRDFITGVAGSTVAWPLAARAQQPAMPVVGFVSSRSVDASARPAAAFNKGLSETGYIEGQNVMVEYHWLSGQNDRLPSLMADLVRRRVAVIATVGDPPTLAAKAATAIIPIAFGISGDPVGHGVVASLARPGGNATGINFLTTEVLAKRLGLLHELVPKAVRVAVLVNPTNTPSAESTLRDVPEATRAIGLQIQV